jgi:ATP-dependent Clp protease protease subunit
VATDLSIEAKEMIRTRQRLYEILADHTGQKLSKIEKDCDRNHWLSSEETVYYGLVDSILKKMPAAAKEK